MVLYFAYGSNTNLHLLSEYLARRGVDPVAVLNPRRAILHDYRLRTNYLMGRLTGAANIEPSQGGRVEGLLMEIAPAVHQALRQKEGWPRRYREIAVTVTIPRTRRIIVALTYVVAEEYRLPIDVPVHPTYRAAVLKGARAACFTQKYQQHLSRVLRTA